MDFQNLLFREGGPICTKFVVDIDKHRHIHALFVPLCCFVLKQKWLKGKRGQN